MRMLPLVPLLLMLGCAVQSGPQPRVISDAVGRHDIVLSWPEGTPMSRVDQLARTACSVGARRAVSLGTKTVNGERVSIYRCEERT